MVLMLLNNGNNRSEDSNSDKVNQDEAVLALTHLFLHTFSPSLVLLKIPPTDDFIFLSALR